MDDATREAIAPVLGRTPSGIFILTATDGAGNETGMLASWVQQASFEPPMVTVAVNKKRYLNDWLQAAPRMALSQVGENQKKLLGHFGRGFEPGVAAFDGVPTAQGETGLPVLTEAMGYLEGRISHSQDAGDHTVYFLVVVAGGVSGSLTDDKPMVHIRKNGFNY